MLKLAKIIFNLRCLDAKIGKNHLQLAVFTTFDLVDYLEFTVAVT